MGTIPASENEYPEVLFAEGAAPGTPGSGLVKAYAKSDGLLYSKDDAGAETALGGGAAAAHIADTSDAHDASAISIVDTGTYFTGTDVEAALQELGAGGGGGNVATDAIWDTAGDIAVGSGADTAAKLAIGNAGGALRRINGALGYDSRTSFPTAATGDIVYRSDLNGQWYYNGSIWLSLSAFQVPFPLTAAVPISATAVLHRMTMPGALGGSDVYLAAVLTSIHVAGGTALSGSHKWVGTVSKSNTAGSSSLGTITIDSGALNQWRPAATLTINAAADIASGYVDLEIQWVKTGTPGNLYANCMLAFRTIAT